MESPKFKECKIKARKVAQYVLVSLWHKQAAIPDKPDRKWSLPKDVEKFLDDLFSLLWIESYRKQHIWESFWKKHSQRLIATAYIFTNYVAYACYLSIENTTNAQACFLEVLSLVAHFSLQAREEGQPKYIHACLEIFCAFFDQELCAKFVEQGGWTNFNEFLENQECLKEFRELEKHTFFVKLDSEHSSRDEPYVINGVVLGDITEDQVETDKRSLCFADSVLDITIKLYNREFEDIVKDFCKKDEQLEKLFCETVGEDFNTMAGGDDQSSQVEATSNLITEENEDRTKEGEDCDPPENMDIDSIQELDQLPKSTRIKVKELLAEMTKDIAKISELIKFICEENGVKVPTRKL